MKSGKTTWRSPSNIAVVKYWGKKGYQMPANPSISMTLANCYTETSIEYTQMSGSTPAHSFLFHGEIKAVFEEKVSHFLEIARSELPGIRDLHFKIESSNSFPHSAGIASSASAISSLALCLCQIDEQVRGISEGEEKFYRNASRIARMGSGSACRSVYGGWVLWGEMADISGSSDEFAIPLPYNLNEKFNTWYDSILIVSSDIKPITSSAGHLKMESNPYKEVKFESGRASASEIIKSLRSGDQELFRKITEYEVAALHAMFLLADPPFLLIKPESLYIIEKLMRFRKESGLEFCFTLDAGPNIHLLYPKAIREKMKPFIETDLLQFCEEGKWIDDHAGGGPELVIP